MYTHSWGEQWGSVSVDEKQKKERQKKRMKVNKSEILRECFGERMGNNEQFKENEFGIEERFSARIEIKHFLNKGGRFPRIKPTAP